MPFRNVANLKPSAKVIAVTGGAGFIGSHLCDTLIDRGDLVVCLDNLSTGRMRNIAGLAHNERFVFFAHDVTEPFSSAWPKFDEIYNLACPASPVHYQADPVQTALICALGTHNILKRAARDGAKVFHASTSETYGDPEVHPQSEEYWGNVNPIGPRSCYDEGKRFAETLLTDYSKQYDVPVRIARIFNTYGPRMQPDDGRVVSNFIVQALEGKPITVYGDGSQTRSFCYVDDLVRGIVQLMDSPAEVDGPINLGNPDEHTVADLAEIIVRMTKSRSTIVRRPLPQDDPRRRRPDIGKASEVLGWAPAIELDYGLRRTIAYFKACIEQAAEQRAVQKHAENRLSIVSAPTEALA